MIQSSAQSLDDSWSWLCNERIPNHPAEGKRIIESLLAELERHQWDDHERFSVHLAIEEALVNAMKHGNQDDLSRFVAVDLRVSTARVWIEIEDEGEGFDPTAVPDPTADENLEVPSGRGLMLMKSYMTVVEYNSRGNRVRMEKCREAAADGRAPV